MVFAFGIFGAGLALAAPSALPQGSYTGTASWRGAGGTGGTYTVEKSFKENTLTAHYAWTEPKAKEETHTVTFALKGLEPFFDLLDEKGQVLGKGYCYDDTCGYHESLGSMTVDETFRWSNGTIVSTGAKSGPGFSVTWKETLKAR
jgi:hypothetical protein